MRLLTDDEITAAVLEAAEQQGTYRIADTKTLIAALWKIEKLRASIVPPAEEKTSGPGGASR